MKIAETKPQAYAFSGVCSAEFLMTCNFQIRSQNLI